MNKYDVLIVRPRIGIGPFRIGMTREKTRDLAEVPVNSFVRNEFSASQTDHFRSISVQADYGSDGLCELITSYALGNAKLFDRILSPLTVAECAAWLQSLGIAFDNDDLGLICRSEGVSFFSEGGLRYPDDRIKAVHVFKDGYYEENK